MRDDAPSSVSRPPQGAAVDAFDPVWDELFPKEKARILQLLLAKVEYHAQDGRVEIEFRPGGVRTLGSESRAAGGSIRG